MAYISSPPPLLPSYDLALDLHSEPDLVHLPSPSYSDDLEALNCTREEVIASKNKLGVVIQHRAWNISDVFRSEEDHQQESPCARGLKLIRPSSPSHLLSDPICPSSSPPQVKMPLISSPVAYPPSSSPPVMPEHRKRVRPADAFSPVKRRLLGNKISFSSEAKQIPWVDNVVSNELPLLDEATISDVRVRHGKAEKSAGPFVADEVQEVQDSSMMFMFEEMHKSTRPQLPTITQMSRLTRGSPRSPPPELLKYIRTTRGRKFLLRKKNIETPVTYQEMVALRSTTDPGKAKTSYYGIDIQKLMDEAKKARPMTLKEPAAPIPETLLPSVEGIQETNKTKNRTLMWTEKYRPRKFTDLVGDERTHRNVLRWLKGWDPIVFPTVHRPKPKNRPKEEVGEDRPHRKILLLTGPPGLGKTTLAHVCAKQAGYEVVEINASDERSREVVKGRIKDCVGTENVRGVNMKTLDGTVRKAGRPVCIVIDEVDGVVSGSNGGGEGGFIKALMDLVVLDQKNTSHLGSGGGQSTNTKKGKKGDRFRLLRPMILICNDVYHPALRPLRASNLAEIIHIRKPPLDKVVARLKIILNKEGIANDNDGVRRLCEAAWGISNKRETRTNFGSTGEGDIRGVLVVGEWVAGRIRASLNSIGSHPRLTKQWIEKNILNDLAHGGSGSRGVGRGGAKEAVDRVFLDGAGFPKTVAAVPPTEQSLQGGVFSAIGVAELGKRAAIERLREIIDTSGECDRIMTDCFTAYPSQPFQDDTFLSKPNAAYNWLHFHDALSSKVFSGQEWELNPYLSQSILAFHHLFASPARRSWGDNQNSQWSGDLEEDPLPFTGPRADFSAYEAEKVNRSLLQQLQSSLSILLLRSFRSPEELATDLLPYLLKMLTPDVKPIIVGGSGEQRGTASVRREGEREMVKRAVDAMSAVNVAFERSRVEDVRGGFGGFVYRMEPPLDTLATFETFCQSNTRSAPTRYAVRQVLDQEFQKYLIRQRADARQARYTAGNPTSMYPDLDTTQESNKENVHKSSAGISSNKATVKAVGVKRDFFGRIITNDATTASCLGKRKVAGGRGPKKTESRVWVSYHEGFSNAVRKPITLEELMRGL